MLMFGARMADGCTSGHALSGTAQGAGSSWLFTPLMFGVGSLLARLARGARRDGHGRSGRRARLPLAPPAWLTSWLISHEATGDSDQKKWRMPMSKAEDDWFGPVVAPAIARAESFRLKMRASVE